jgi:ABC-type proline/glycine betaine transport system substrate-binding protein
MNNPQMNPATILTQMLSMGNNPQQILQNMANQNPQVNALINQMQQSGLTPKQFVMQYAKQNNINIQPFINAMNNRGINI